MKALIKHKRRKHPFVVAELATPDMVVYTSGEEGETNTNSKFKNIDDEEIRCRHLSWAWLLDQKTADQTHPYRKQFASQEGVLSNPYLKEGAFDTQNISLHADSYHALPVIHDNALGLALSHACQDLAVGGEKKFLFATENHMMAFKIKLKEKDGLRYYSIKFYDPNRTLVHTRVIAKNIYNLSQLRLDSLLPPDYIDTYCPSMQMGVLCCFDHLEKWTAPDKTSITPTAKKEIIAPEFGPVHTPLNLFFKMGLNLTQTLAEDIDYILT